MYTSGNRWENLFAIRSVQTLRFTKKLIIINWVSKRYAHVLNKFLFILTLYSWISLPEEYQNSHPALEAKQKVTQQHSPAKPMKLMSYIIICSLWGQGLMRGKNKKRYLQDKGADRDLSMKSICRILFHQKFQHLVTKMISILPYTQKHRT